jgi:hypothetical protein
MGHFEESLADGRTRYGETYTCAHCNSVVEYRDNMGQNDKLVFCPMEHTPICPKCAARAGKTASGCEVFEKKMEKIEARDRMLRSMGLVP